MRAVKGAALFLAAGLFLAMLCPIDARASDFSMVNELDFTEIQDAVDEILGGEFRFKDTVMEMIQGGQPFTLEGFLTSVFQQVSGNWKTEKNILLSILVLGIAAALLANFSNIFQNQQIAEVSFEITYMLLFLILLQVFSGAAELTESVISGIQEFMSALIPSYFLAVTMASGGTTAIVFYQFLLSLIYLIGWLIEHGLMALIHVQIILVFINHLTKEEYLSRMTEMVTKAAGWILKSMLAVVVGFNTIQGILSPAIDSLKTTMFSRAAEMIPGIGNIAGSVTDVILGSAILIKNGIGVAALIAIVLICLVPLVKLGTIVLILELAAALIQPVSDKRMVGCVAGVSEGVKLLFRVVFTTAVLFLVTIVVVTVSTGGKL